MTATVRVPRLMTADEATARVGDPVPVMEPNVTSATIYRDLGTGEVILGYLPLGDAADLRRAVLGIKYGTTARNAGYTNVSRTFGYSPRKAIYGQEGCRPAALASESPDAHTVLTLWSTKLATTFAEFAPEVAARDDATIAEVAPDWRLAESSLWTSGVINRSSRLPYHRDRFNFPTWSAMPVLRRHMDGGYLDIPEYGLTVACRDGYGVFFAGHELVHGVTPMTPTRADGYRYSVVYYALKGMRDCYTAAIETEYAKRRRTTRERDIAQKIESRK
jgi:hypothetical protein